MKFSRNINSKKNSFRGNYMRKYGMPKKLGIGSGLYEISVRYLGGSDTIVIFTNLRL